MPANVETMFSAVETPWHKLAVVTPDVLTAQEAIVTAGLDWLVDLKPIYFTDQVQEMQNVANKFAVVRQTDDKCYGVVGNRYTPVQNLDAFNFMDNLVDSGDAKYETAGSLNGGATIFIQMRLDKVLPIDDDVVPYILLTNNHNGSGSLKVIMTPVRVVCSNTLRWALNNAKNSISLRHTKSIAGKIDEARNILGLTELFYDSFSEQVNKLIDTELTKDKFDELMNKMFPVPKLEKGDTTENQSKVRQYNNTLSIRDKIRSNYASEKQNGNKNAWGVLNAYNSYELWQKNQRGAKTTNAKLEKQGTYLINDDSRLTTAVVKELIKL